MSVPTAPTPRPIVVYVDDERPNRVVFEHSFAGDFDIRTTGDVNEALALLANADTAVIVTDMRMPTMSGTEVLQLAKERHPRVIRMVMTAYADVEPILRAINEGLVARYVIKPWEPAEVAQVLRWAIEAWRFSRDSDALHRRLLETERLATLGSISGMLVHDLRQPLVSLMMNIDQLRELVGAVPLLDGALAKVDIPDERRAEVSAMLADLEPITSDLRTSVDHLNAVLNQLRELGRPRKVEGPPSTAPLPIVRQAMAVCHELALSFKATIDYKGPAELPRVRMSATELTQVLINVLANGTQAVGRRGAAHGKVTISAAIDGGMLEFKIRDNGAGMTKDVLDRVGTPFFTTREEGTGLGVAQCQRLVGSVGGRWQIDSEVGIGTTVMFLLPIAA